MTKHILASLIVLVILLAALPASAQVLLRNAKIHTGDGDVLEKGSVLLDKDGRISAVGASVEAPAGAEVIDCGSKVITPGLIDVHTRLGLVEIWAVKATRDADPGFEGDLVRAAFRAADAFNPGSHAIPITRTGGVTSVVAVPAGGLVGGQAAWADLGGSRFFGEVVAPYVAQSIVLGSSGSRVTGGSRGGSVLRLQELFDDVRFYAANKRNYDQNRTRTLHASRLDLEALEATTSGKIPVLFEVNRADEILAALDFAKANGLKPIVVGGAEAWKVAERLAAEKVAVVVNPLANLPSRFESLGAREDNAALLHAAGVPVILSTFDSHNVRNLRQYAGNAVRAGLPHDAALAAVTSTAAKAFGMNDYGTIEKGKVANVVVWSGDPFELTTRVDAYFVGGKKTSTQNRQSALLEKYRELKRRGEPAEKK